MAVIMITHDLGVVAEVADDVHGHVRRARWSSPGTLDQIFYDPQHPYTWGLLGSLTRIDRPRDGAAGADRRPAALADRAARRAVTSAPAARTRSDRCTAAPAARAAGRRGRARRPLLAAAEQKQTLRVDRRRRDRARGAGRMTEGHEPSRPSRRARARMSAPATSPPRRRRDRRPASRARRSSRSTTSSSTSRSRPGSSSTARSAGCGRSTTSRSPSTRARRSGLVGESGCGKSTLSRTILQLIRRPRARSGSRARRSPACSRAAAPLRPQDADDLPGPLRVAQPAQARRADHRRSDAAARDRQGRRGAPGGPGAAGDGRAQPRALQPLPARVLGRPAPADRDREGARR